MLVLAAALRLLAALRNGIIETDGALYASCAAALLRGDWVHGVSTVWPPLYPLAIAAVALPWVAVGGAPTPELLETGGRLVSIGAGTLLLLPVYDIARRLLGPGRGNRTESPTRSEPAGARVRGTGATSSGGTPREAPA